MGQHGKIGGEMTFRWRGMWTKMGLAAAMTLMGATAMAQPRLPDRIHQLIHRTWTSDDGLPSNSVTAIAQDKQGYLWFATSAGLARFDGTRFTVYDRHTSSLLKSSFISGVQIVGDAIWFAAKGSGLGSLRDGQLELLSGKDGLTNTNTHVLLADQRGTLWMTTESGGLFSLRNGRFERLGTTDGLPSNELTALASEAGVRLWIGTAGSGLAVREGNIVRVFTKAHGLPSDTITSLHVGRSGLLYVGTDKGVVQREDDRFVPVAADPRLSVSVRALREDRSGRLWIGTDGAGLALVDGENVDWFTSRDGLSRDQVEAIFQDAEGGIWVATQGGGLDVFWSGGFSTYGVRDGLGSDVVLSLLYSSDGAVWIGTAAGGLARIDEQGVRPFGPQDGLGPSGVISLLEDSKGRILAGTIDAGVRVLSGSSYWKVLDDRLSTSRVPAMVEGPDGAVWIGTGAGLMRFMDSERKVFGVEDGFPADNIQALAFDAQGALWVGTNGGLAVMRGEVVATVDRGRPLPQSSILSIRMDGERLWLGTDSAGVVVVDRGTTTTLTTEQGLLDDSAFGFLDDGDGRMWVSCPLGIYSITKRSVDQVIAGEQDLVSKDVYGVSDGLKTGQCVGGSQNVVMRTPDERLWFATQKGVSVVASSFSRRSAKAPLCRIEEVRVDGKGVALGDPVILRSKAKTLEIRYSAASALVQDRIRFEYRLDGYDTDWIEVGARLIAYYTNLDAGDYTLRVRAITADAAGYGTEATLRLRREPRYFETWWFIGICIAGVFLPVALLFRVRTLRIVKRHRELEKVVEGRTEELRRLNQELEEFALRDPLTGLRSRRFLFEVVEPQAALVAARSQLTTLGLDRRANPRETIYGVFLLHLDDFKRINNELGHDAGDMVLGAVARAISRSVRGDDEVVRWGGGEFLVILKDTQSTFLQTFAAKVLDAVSARPLTEVRGTPLRIGCSVGMVAYPPSQRFPKTLSLEQAIFLASKALDVAKDDREDCAVQVIVDDVFVQSEQDYSEAFLSLGSRPSWMSRAFRFEPLPRRAR